MSRPGVEVTSAASAPPVGVPTDTSVGFVVAEAAMGPTTQPTLITSLDQFTQVYGQRLAAAPLGYDTLDAAFHEGLASCYFMRIAQGGAAASGSAATICGAGSTINAANVGAWGNTATLTLALAPTLLALAEGDGPKRKSKKDDDSDDEPRAVVLEGLTYDDGRDAPEEQVVTNYVATVSIGGNAVQTSLNLVTNQDLANFLASGGYLTLSGATLTNNITGAGTVTLTGGTDGTVPVTTGLAAALSLITPDLGPGQLSCPGKTDSTSLAAMLAHCAGTSDIGVNRVALLDSGQNDSNSTCKATAASLRGSIQDRYGSLWAPWAIIPGTAPGTTRTVPWSAIQLGLCARNDLLGNPNQAAAGSWGVSTYALDLAQNWTPAQMQDMLYAGVNTARQVYDQIEAFAFRTLVDPAGPRQAWVQLNHARLNMAIVAEANAIGYAFDFAQIDGRQHTIAKFNGQLAGMLKEFYDEDALFGDDVTQAFIVNTGPAVNTPDKIANGILSAVLSVRMSPHAELVQIAIAKYPITVDLTP